MSAGFPLRFHLSIISCLNAADICKIFDAMSRRRATFLAEDDWRTVPWESIPKTDVDRLMDIQVFLPRIFELEEQLETSPPSSDRAEKAKTLFQKCIQVDKVFENWYFRLQIQSDKPLFRPLPWNSKRQKTAKELGFDMCCAYTTYLEFLDLRIAFLHLYYWAGLTLFYRTMQNIHRMCYNDFYFRPSNSPELFTPAHPLLVPASTSLKLSPSPATLSHTLASTPSNQTLAPYEASHPFATTPSPPSSYGHTSPTQSFISDYSPIPPLDSKYSEEAIGDIAHNICRSLPYALDRTLHELGPDHSAWPIWCALQVFKRQGVEEEMSWCTEMMEMWSREGWKFASQMGRVDWMDYRSAGS
jgi:hypothetical protein